MRTRSTYRPTSTHCGAASYPAGQMNLGMLCT